TVRRLKISSMGSRLSTRNSPMASSLLFMVSERTSAYRVSFSLHPAIMAGGLRGRHAPQVADSIVAAVAAPVAAIDAGVLFQLSLAHVRPLWRPHQSETVCSIK